MGNVNMSEESRAGLAESDKNAKYPSGVGRIDRGECPAGAATAMACMFCPFGHMLECHYPKTCSEAQCSHYLREVEEDGL